ncbi:PREDICTED: uncharacterized protein LOC102255189 [Myotis brandtii]|uniref:uncharacterized protein LOC102255189 n=1 Tax=Myotis brandtii TaxID=109478 RepID=UPI0003BBE145|nr:PREDICTED: uncharacterized protein LOC102255189 [Myotis brandtii]
MAQSERVHADGTAPKCSSNWIQKTPAFSVQAAGLPSAWRPGHLRRPFAEGGARSPGKHGDFHGQHGARVARVGDRIPGETRGSTEAQGRETCRTPPRPRPHSLLGLTQRAQGSQTAPEPASVALAGSWCWLSAGDPGCRGDPCPVASSCPPGPAKPDALWPPRFISGPRQCETCLPFCHCTPISGAGIKHHRRCLLPHASPEARGPSSVLAWRLLTGRGEMERRGLRTSGPKGEPSATCSASPAQSEGGAPTWPPPESPC